MTAEQLAPEPPDVPHHRSAGLAELAVTAGPATTTRVDVVVPVYNEQADLVSSITRLEAFLAGSFPYEYRIVIVDNASTDDTWRLATALSRRLASVQALHLDRKGRGWALRQAWLDSDADILCYMDVDLSTDLRALLPLVAPLVSGHSDLAIGTRLARGSRVSRGPKREFISRSYNLILRSCLRVSFSDAQCGFKAIRRDVAGVLVPLVADNNWFFDTELLVLAQRVGLRIHEVPVDWVDDPGSTVDIVATAREDLRGIWRVGRGLWSGSIPIERIRTELHRDAATDAVPGVPGGLFGQLVRFGAVGVASTAAYFALYLLLRPFGAQAANLAALLMTAIANTAANRWFTFGVSGRAGVLKHHIGGLAAFGVALALTSGSLALLHQLWPAADRLIEVTALVVANALATLLRFLTLRTLMRRS